MAKVGPKNKGEAITKKVYLYINSLNYINYRTTPVGVASLIGKTLAYTKNLEDDFSRLGLFIGTVMIGLAILTFICVPLTHFMFTRSNPFKFMLTMLQPGMIVMATAST